MIRRPSRPRPRQSERGVTMLLVAVAMFAMLAMVALAIDVITLYSARSETQRVADSAALAAAKVLVDSGQLTDPATYQTGAQALATQLAKDISNQLSIAARQVQPADVAVAFGSGTGGFGVNPTVTVTVQNAFVPAFFSRIFNRTSLTVSATATAEAFTPSGSGSGAPVVARCIKPFLIPNCDPVLGTACGGAGTVTFFNTGSGAVTNTGVAPAGVIGEEFDLFSNCIGPGDCTTYNPPAVAATGPGGNPTLFYYPAQFPTMTTACPSCYTGTTDFERNISCCNAAPISCGTTATSPVSNQLQLDTTVFPDGHFGPAQDGVQCLIHEGGLSGQDSLVTGPPLTYPLQIQVGTGHPLRGSGLTTGDLVTTSDSLVTIPVYDEVAAGGAPAAPVQIVGFLQVFINDSFQGGGPKAGVFHVTVVNVLGCGSSATGAPVSAAAAVPIRLIHQ